MKLFFCLIFAVVALVVHSNPTDEILSGKLSPTNRVFNGQPISLVQQYKYKFNAKFATRRPAPEKPSACNGAIITQFTIVTAAHCLARVISMDIFFGVLDRSDILFSEDYQKQTVGPEAFRIHPDYVPTINDIALVILPKAIRISEIVGPVNMAPPTEKCDEYIGKYVTISGWGATETENAPLVLRSVNLFIADPQQCSRYFRSFNKTSMLCEGDSMDTAACPGDSGGPVVINYAGEQKLIGVVSFGNAGCGRNGPGVSTCIAAHYHWIEKNLK